MVTMTLEHAYGKTLEIKGVLESDWNGYQELEAGVVFSKAQQKQLEDLMVKDLTVKNYLF